MNSQTRSGTSPWTILKLLKWTTAYFTSHDIENPRASAEILLAHTLGLRRIDLYIRYEQPLIAEELDRFKGLIKRRVRHEPVAYITGEKEFWSMALRVSPDVLIPRPETECLVESALNLMTGEGRPPLRIMDLGTGSGAIILAIAKEKPGHILFAADRSVAALRMARSNAISNALEADIRFSGSDWFSGLKDERACFDMIVSNPPYIPSGQINDLQPEIRLYEPNAALDGGRDGLDAIRDLIFSAHRFLGSGGHLLMEIGHDQRAAVADIAAACGHYVDIDFDKDYAGHDRVARMTRR